MIKEIQAQKIAAMKNKDKEKNLVMGTILSELKNKAIDERKDMNDFNESEIMSVLQKMVNQRKESLSFYEKAEREDLASKEMLEISIIETLLPKQLSQEEVEAIIKEAINVTGASSVKDMGKVMGYLKEKAGASINMKEAGAFVKKMI